MRLSRLSIKGASTKGFVFKDGIVRMGRGSPLCAKLRERIVSQFEDNVSQCKISNNLGLSTNSIN